MAEVFPLDINDTVAEDQLSSDDDIIEVIRRLVVSSLLRDSYDDLHHTGISLLYETKT